MQTQSPPAAVRETHTALLFFVGEHVYKIKKPVDLGFVDFRTRAAREQACRHELGLNRRLAPEVYRGLGSITSPDRDEAEPVVVMRRLPPERSLARRVADGVDVEDDLRALARLLAVFHARAERTEAIAACAGPDGLLRRWADNLDETERFVPLLLDERVHDDIRALATAFVEGRRPLLDGRAADGCSVDGHGDLTAEDVFCLDGGPQVLDCLDFDDRLRWVDVLDDAAFLAADLEHLGRADLGQRFLQLYREFSGQPAPDSLVQHYLAYRAFVRAKVACLRADQSLDVPAHDAERIAQVALAHLELGEVRLVLVGGAPGTGKSTLAGALADQLGAVLLSTDRVRQDHAVDEAGRYTPAAKDAVYRDLLAHAERALQHGETVVADATWGDRAWRSAAAATAATTASALVPIECRAPVEVAARRAQDRLASGGSASEAGADVARALAAHRDPWLEATGVDTGGSLGSALETACALAGRKDLTWTESP